MLLLMIARSECGAQRLYRLDILRGRNCCDLFIGTEGMFLVARLTLRGRGRWILKRTTVSEVFA